jgi:hypothetical protein
MPCAAGKHLQDQFHSGAFRDPCDCRFDHNYLKENIRTRALCSVIDEMQRSLFCDWLDAEFVMSNPFRITDDWWSSWRTTGNNVPCPSLHYRHQISFSFVGHVSKRHLHPNYHPVSQRKLRGNTFVGQRDSSDWSIVSIRLWRVSSCRYAWHEKSRYLLPLCTPVPLDCVEKCWLKLAPGSKGWTRKRCNFMLLYLAGHLHLWENVFV